MGVLQSILASKQRSLERLRRTALPTAPARRPIALRRAPNTALRLIAEIKHRSPSAGPLSTRLTVGERASAYERAGASLVSVLCEEDFFGGSYLHLAETRRSCGLPLLCKDFVIDEVQLDAARAWGADAVLLIVRCVGFAELGDLVRATLARGLEPLIEVATAEEAQMALATEARMIGVNARDLDTLAMDSERAAQIIQSLPPSAVAIHLSGLKTPDDVARVAHSRADAALVGETLMRLDDPEPLLRQLVAATLAGH